MSDMKEIKLVRRTDAERAEYLSGEYWRLRFSNARLKRACLRLYRENCELKEFVKRKNNEDDVMLAMQYQQSLEDSRL